MNDYEIYRGAASGHCPRSLIRNNVGAIYIIYVTVLRQIKKELTNSQTHTHKYTYINTWRERHGRFVKEALNKNERESV